MDEENEIMTEETDEGPKKGNALVYILDILQKYTDCDHPMVVTSAKKRNFKDMLEDEYGLLLERKTISNKLYDLQAMCESLQLGEIVHESKSKGWYFISNFDEGEIDYLVDCVLASGNITEKDGNELIEKLGRLICADGSYTSQTGAYRPHKENIKRSAGGRSWNKELFYNISELNKAIDERKMVRFYYGHVVYDESSSSFSMGYKTYTDKETGEEKRCYYKVSPYQLAAHDGKCYLVCCLHGKNKLSQYRVDKISGLRVWEDKNPDIGKRVSYQDMDKIAEKSEGETFIDTHTNMTIGDPERIEFKLREPDWMLGAALDFFGPTLRVLEVNNGDEKSARCLMKTTPEAMIQFACEYALNVQVISPESVAEEVVSRLKAALEVYKKF